MPWCTLTTAPEAGVNIGQAASAAGVSAKMIRHYEGIGLLPRAQRSQSNYRLYGSDDVHVLRFIRRARVLGFAIEDIRGLLGLWRDRRRPSAAVKKIAARHVGELRNKIAELESMVQTLEHLAKHCHGDHRPDCPILEDLARP
jgi:MerR family transcriptional regulator, copper efflux regulator